jgi:hypothetical protein
MKYRRIRVPVALLALLSFAFPCLSAAQEPAPPADDAEIRALIDEAGGAADNGGADLVTVFRRTTVDVEDSGLGHIRDWRLVKCLSESGAAQLARIRLDFDPASNYVEVRGLRVLRKSGEIEELPLDSGVDLPQPQAGIYWGAQMKLVPIPRLGIGDAVEIKTYMKGFLIAYLDEMREAAASGAGGADEDESRYIPPMRGHFYDVVYFQEPNPVKLRHYTVRTPRDKPVQFEVYNGEVMAHAAFDDEQLSYSFWKQDLEAFHSEPRAVDFPDVQPKVVLATVPDWPAKSRWFCQVNEPQFEATDAIKAKVAELTDGLATDEEKIAEIVHWSADEIRYSGISMGKGEGYTLHTGEMIFNDRSGVCKDKAGIAITMLRAAGYTVWPAMTMAGSRVERIPADQFNHCVVALEQENGEFLMLDPTWVVFSPELWSSAEGEQHFVVGTPDGVELMRTASFDPADNKLRVESKATLAADGSLSGTLVFSGKGYADQRLRRELVHYTIGVDRQGYFENLMAQLAPGVELDAVDVPYAAIRDWRTPLRWQLDYRAPEFALAADDAIYFSPPTARHLIRSSRLAPYLDCADASERTQDLLLWAPRMREVVETITLPPGYKVARLPDDRHIDGPVASLKTNISVQGRELTFTFELVIKQRQIPVADYANFREVVQEALALPEDLIVLERS